MQKRGSLFHKVAVIFCYAALFVLATYFGKATSYVDTVFFAIGLILGVALLEADESILYKYYQEPETTSTQLMTRSLLFILALFPLGIFLMTSTGSALGVGLFLSLTSSLSLELLALQNQPEAFAHRFLQQLKRPISNTERTWFTYACLALSVAFAVAVIFFGR